MHAWSATAAISAVVLIDLDDFKSGERHARPRGRRLRCWSRWPPRLKAAGQLGADVIARLGGDEFATAIPIVGFTRRHRALSPSRRAQRGLGSIRKIEGAENRRRAPASAPRSRRTTSSTPTRLLKLRRPGALSRKAVGARAPSASSSRNGRSDRERGTLEMESAMPGNGGSSSCTTSRRVGVSPATMRGFEALLRWRNRRAALVSPGNFTPIAEESG